MSEYKKYDSQTNFQIWNARVAKDVKVFENDRGKSAQVTFVVSSRNEKDEDIWLTARLSDRDAELASFLEKGDVLGFSGQLVNTPWGEPKKMDLGLRYARMYPSIELFVKLKERGFTPGQVEAPAPKKAPPPVKKPPVKRPVVQIPDDEE